MIQHIQEPKLLKSALKKIYHKYCKDMRYDDDNTDQDPQAEYSRQRENLERTITSLRRKGIKDQIRHRSDNVRIIQENVVLISEINHLRKDLGVLGKKEKSAEAMLKLKRGLIEFVPLEPAESKRESLSNSAPLSLSERRPSSASGT
jgi:hypothetical protein